MAVPASRFIADLGPRKSGGGPGSSVVPHLRTPEAQPTPEALQLFSMLSKSDPEQRVTDAHAKGLEEGRAAVEAAWSEKLEEQRLFHEKQLSVERLTWASREAEKLEQQLTAGLARLQTQIADTVADLLKPFLIGAARRDAIDALARTLETMLSEGATVEISGSEDLLRVLREKLSGKNVAIVFTPADSPEVRATAGQTILETQLGMWIAKVEEAFS